MDIIVRRNSVLVTHGSLRIKLMYDVYNERLLVQLTEEIVTKGNTKYSLRGSDIIVVPRF